MRDHLHFIRWFSFNGFLIKKWCSSSAFINDVVFRINLRTNKKKCDVKKPFFLRKKKSFSRTQKNKSGKLLWDIVKFLTDYFPSSRKISTLSGEQFLYTDFIYQILHECEYISHDKNSHLYLFLQANIRHFYTFAL